MKNEKRSAGARSGLVGAAVLLGTVLLLAACGGGGKVGGIEKDVAGADGRFETIDGAGRSQVVDGRATADAMDLKVPPVDIGADGGDAFLECEAGQGCFGDPCDENAACLSSICLEHLGDKVCSKLCIEECPAGFKCEPINLGGPDPSFACISQFPFLCRPCGENGDCTATWGGGEVCVDYGEEGSFCGGACDDENACPPDFACEETATVEGVPVTQCLPQSTICECSATSISMGRVTPCEVVNEYGSCHGQRFCADSGLTECDAAEPGEEVCNGKDDDCDGVVDGPGSEGEPVCHDGDSCTADSCLGEDGCAYEPLSDVECDDADACTGSDFCTDGMCGGAPVSCDDGEVCTYDTCYAASGCGYIFSEENCDDGDPCTVGDSCQEGECSGIEVACDCTGDADCALLEDGDVCNGTLLCDTSQVPFKCAVAPDTVVECAEAEGVDAFCLAPVCDPESGECSFEQTHQGLACSDGDACTLGDVCTQGACTSQSTLNCDDENVCTEDSCDLDLGCNHVPTEGACDDGNPCTVGDYCAEGACMPAGPLDCEDGNVCTTDGCYPGSGCSNVPNTAPCSDGDACSQGDQCAGGDCHPGGEVDCDDLNVCTDDSCSPDSGCLHAANQAACDDENPCTSGDHCEGGMCVGAAAIECNDHNPCTDDLCDLVGGCKYVPNSGACDDGSACTVGDYCEAGECLPGPTANCGDNNPCTDDSCDADEGCQHTNNSGPCDDSNQCTDDDLCLDGICMPGAAVVCDDLNLCTSDGCLPGQGCIHVPNAAPCNDDNACTLADYCNLGECLGGPAYTCEDNNPCTDDSCDPEVGCQFVPNAAACDDGNPCTVDDTCSGGWCKGGGTADCGDGDVCTNDLCSLAEGCYHVHNEAPCNDGNECTMGDVCADGLCAPGPVLISCNDGDDCTADSCNPDTGCEHEIVIPCCGNGLVDDDEACDDGNNDSGDGCSGDCMSDESCGNGILDPDSEACDGDLFPVECHQGDFACLDDCQTLDTSQCQSWCGDGAIDGDYEACDDGAFPTECYDGQFECELECKYWNKSGCNEWCGDSLANGPEDCDGFDFAAACPLSQCYCSSDCVIYFDEEQTGQEWDEGDYDGVSTDPPEEGLDPACYEPDTLCLDVTTSELKHVWIANSNDHEVVRINVDTAEVEKEIPSHGENPSRTAVVVKDGSVWVGNRCYDHDGDPACSNLVHLDIEGNFICRGDVIGLVRAVALDADGNVWAGSWKHHKMFKFSGTEVDEDQDPPRCKQLAELDVAGCPYGAAGDNKGNMWLNNNCSWASSFDPGIQSLQVINTKTNTVGAAYVAPSDLAGCFQVYGLTVDGQGRAIMGSYSCYGLFRFTPDTETWEWISTGAVGAARGVVVDQEGYIYAAISHNGGSDRRHIVRVESDFSAYTSLDMGGGIAHPVGTAIDHNGWLWTAGRNSDTCARVDIANWGNNPTVETFPTLGDDPYSYSDMTGFQHLMFTNPEGKWTGTFDGGADTVFWKLIEWEGIEEEGVTDIMVRARSAATEEALAQAGWTAYFTTSPAQLQGLPMFRWLEVEVKLTSSDPDKTPVLTKVMVHWTK